MTAAFLCFDHSSAQPIGMSAISLDASSLLAACRSRIAAHVHRTPLMTSRQLSSLSGATLFFKCENFQGTGSFKLRGAVNAALSLSDQQRERGLVTHSSGNFAAALALAARRIGAAATIVMPSNAPQVKKDAVQGYGATIVECEPVTGARQAAADRIVAETGAAFVHPSNELPVIVGQGTAASELLEDQPDLDAVLAPVGGGGLIGGTVLAAQACITHPLVFGAEPANMDDAYRSLASGKLETNPPGADTIADGLKTSLGDVNFPLIQQGVEAIVRVSEEEILEAMRLVWERMKLVIEPSAAVAVAALLQRERPFAGRRVGVILSGGNVDTRSLPF